MLTPTSLDTHLEVELLYNAVSLLLVFGGSSAYFLISSGCTQHLPINTYLFCTPSPVLVYFELEN